MSNYSQVAPAYRLHKPSGRAVVTIGGRDIYLGKYNSAASRREYKRVIAEWAVHGGTLPKHASDMTIIELCAAFMRHAKTYYRRQDGSQTNELKNFKLSIRRLNDIYGRTRAADFGPLALKAIRQQMIDDDLARRNINQHVNRLRHIFKWAVENELIASTVLHGLQAVSGLRAGRSKAKETAPIRPVPDAFVDAVLDYLSPQVAAMIQLQRLTGMRSGEVTAMRGADINTSGRVWVYSPEQHKTAWHGHQRQVYLGPKAQKIIKPFLLADLQAYLFAPANGRRFGIISDGRKTKAYPCELRRREKQRAERQARGRKTKIGERYDTISYYRALTYGIDAANRDRLAEAVAGGIDPARVDLVPHWHPHQLRHNAATNLRREHGIEVARIILGHRSPAITELYAEVDHARAVDVMAQVG
jgi:integrase